MERACSTYGEDEKFIQGSGYGHLREEIHFEDTGVDGIIILKWIFWEVG